MLLQGCARASRPCVYSSCRNSCIAQVLVRMPHADIWEQRSLQSHELACVRNKRSEIAGEKRVFRLVPEPLRRVSRLSGHIAGLGMCATYKSLLLYTIRRCSGSQETCRPRDHHFEHYVQSLCLPVLHAARNRTEIVPWSFPMSLFVGSTVWSSLLILSINWHAAAAALNSWPSRL
jgi:hypothetical protein